MARGAFKPMQNLVALIHSRSRLLFARKTYGVRKIADDPPVPKMQLRREIEVDAHTRAMTLSRKRSGAIRRCCPPQQSAMVAAAPNRVAVRTQERVPNTTIICQRPRLGRAADPTLHPFDSSDRAFRIEASEWAAPGVRPCSLFSLLRVSSRCRRTTRSPAIRCGGRVTACAAQGSARTSSRSAQER